MIFLKNSKYIPDGDESHRKDEDNLYDFGRQEFLKTGAAINAQKAAGAEQGAQRPVRGNGQTGMGK